MLSYILKAKNRDTLTNLRARLSAREIQVSRMATVFGPDCDYQKWTIEQVEFWLSLQAHRYNPANVMGFAAWVGHGCEPMVFGLAETDQGLIYEGFCETYGDKTPSFEVFEHRHCQACGMLEDAKLSGFDLDVVDHSGYWTSRSLWDLRKAVKDTNELAALIERAATNNPLLRVARALIGHQCEVRPS
jgi:hypothetical protein